MAPRFQPVSSSVPWGFNRPFSSQIECMTHWPSLPCFFTTALRTAQYSTLFRLVDLLILAAWNGLSSRMVPRLASLAPATEGLALGIQIFSHLSLLHLLCNRGYPDNFLHPLVTDRPCSSHHTAVATLPSYSEQVRPWRRLLSLYLPPRHEPQ
jgi:hypothetical protein